MKLLPIVFLMLCTSAQAADPCPPRDWCGFQQQSDYALLQQQINAMRSEAELERSLDSIRREDARWERVQHDIDVQEQLDRQRTGPLFNLPGMPAR